MSIISLTRGIITLSTAGGAALGGYFASGSFGNVSASSEKIIDQSGEGKRGNGETQDSSNTLESEDSRHSDELSTKEQKDLKSKDFSSESEKISRGIQVEQQNYVPLNSGTNDLSRFSREEEGWLEQGANWNKFLNEIEGNIEHWDSNDGEEVEGVGLVVEYYRDKDKSYGIEEEVSCERWYLKGENSEDMTRISCQDFNTNRNWGKRTLEKPAAWVKVDMDYAEKVLQTYKLIDESTTYKKTNGTWTTKHWLCTLEKTSGNFLIGCDYYLSPFTNNS